MRFREDLSLDLILNLVFREYKNLFKEVDLIYMG